MHSHLIWKSAFQIAAQVWHQANIPCTASTLPRACVEKYKAGSSLGSSCFSSSLVVWMMFMHVTEVLVLCMNKLKATLQHVRAIFVLRSVLEIFSRPCMSTVMQAHNSFHGLSTARQSCPQPRLAALQSTCKFNLKGTSQMACTSRLDS